MGARALRVERRITPPSVASPDAVAVCVRCRRRDRPLRTPGRALSAPTAGGGAKPQIEGSLLWRFEIDRRGFDNPPARVAPSLRRGIRNVSARGGRGGGLRRFGGESRLGRAGGGGRCARPDGDGDHPVHGRGLGRPPQFGGEPRVRGPGRFPMEAGPRLHRFPARGCGVRVRAARAPLRQGRDARGHDPGWG